MYKSYVFIIFSALIFGIGNILIPNSAFDKNIFDSQTEEVANIEIIRYTQSNYDYYQLEITTLTERIYYLRKPDPEELFQYSSRIPNNKPLFIIYKENDKNHEIISMKTDEINIIPFEDYVADLKTKKNTINKTSLLFLLLGILGIILEIIFYHKKIIFTKENFITKNILINSVILILLYLLFYYFNFNIFPNPPDLLFTTSSICAIIVSLALGIIISHHFEYKYSLDKVLIVFTFFLFYGIFQLVRHIF